MTSLFICWLYWIDLHQAFSLHGHTAVRRHQTLVLRTYSTPRRGLDAKLNMSTWLNLTSSLLARALITNAGCMTERPKLSHNRESPHHADAPAATTHYWLDCRPGGADFFSFFSADWRVDLPFLFSFREKRPWDLSFPRWSIHTSEFKQRNCNGDDCICLLGVTIAICPTVIISFQCVCQN